MRVIKDLPYLKWTLEESFSQHGEFDGLAKLEGTRTEALEHTCGRVITECCAPTGFVSLTQFELCLI
jgi:hypothetical protein